MAALDRKPEAGMMQWFYLLAATLMAAANNWSFLESGDPKVRQEQTVNQTEDLRRIQGEWFLWWPNDQGTTTHLTPIRVEGSIGP
jgi:hypothetical protein